MEDAAVQALSVLSLPFNTDCIRQHWGRAAINAHPMAETKVSSYVW